MDTISERRQADFDKVHAAEEETRKAVAGLDALRQERDTAYQILGRYVVNLATQGKTP